MRKGETISKHVAILNPNWRERFSKEVIRKIEGKPVHSDGWSKSKEKRKFQR